MSSISDLTNLSREQLHSVISQLKREVNYLKTDVIKYKILLKDYKNYFNHFNAINERISSNKEILVLIQRLKDMKDMNESLSLVSMVKLKEKDLKQFGLKLEDILCKINVKSSEDTDNNQIESKEKLDEKKNLLIVDNQVKGEDIKDIIQYLEDSQVIKEMSDLGTDCNPMTIEYNDNDYDPNDEQIDVLSDEEEWVEPNPKTNTKNNKPKDQSMGTFKCRFEGCSSVFNSSGSLKRHSDRHLGKFSCDFKDCNFKAGDNYHLERHKKSRHSDKKLFKCSHKDCDKSYKSQDSLREHLKSHCNTEQSSQPNYCVCDHVGCGQRFLRASDLKKHKEKHSGIRYNCEFQGCSSNFSLKRSLTKHMAVHNGTYRCDWSGCSFCGNSPSNLAKHKLLRHSEDTPFKCQINSCDKEFKLRKYLNSHQLREHPLEMADYPWLECQTSGCHFKTKFNMELRKHRQSVHNSGLHTCPECPKQFHRRSDLKKHMAVHSDLRFACEWFGCDRVFTRKDILNDHMNIHTAQKVFRCHWPGCDKTFNLRTSHSVHVLRHKGRTYDCALCDFRSPTPKPLEIHMKIHENQSQELIEPQNYGFIESNKLQSIPI